MMTSGLFARCCGKNIAHVLRRKVLKHVQTVHYLFPADDLGPTIGSKQLCGVWVCTFVLSGCWRTVKFERQHGACASCAGGLGAARKTSAECASDLLEEY